MKAFPRLFAALFAVVFAGHALASPDAVIAQARAALGSERLLDGIHSIHFSGKLASQERVKDKDGKEITRPFNATIDIIFQKPYRQRVVLVSYKGTEVTALDDYEAWRRLEDATNASRWSLTLLDKEQIKRLRASTWENLAFFRGIERSGGNVEDLGPVTIDGHSCEKLAFVHDPGIAFYRYFDAATGQLLLTELESGDSIREEGELVVNGVRFPKKLIYTTKDPASIVIITVDKITLNETFPDSLFAVPMLTVK
ncbi:MAG TPA: hypothetical protein VNW23_05010 [Opitutaceae bacterium]|nr:hypothetical protein [Opitutaceae bacterium]